MKYIKIKGLKYYYYDTYSTIDEARRICKYHRKRSRSRNFIITRENGWIIPHKVYDVYLNKVIRL